MQQRSHGKGTRKLSLSRRRLIRGLIASRMGTCRPIMGRVTTSQRKPSRCYRCHTIRPLVCGIGNAVDGGAPVGPAFRRAQCALHPNFPGSSERNHTNYIRRPSGVSDRRQLRRHRRNIGNTAPELGRRDLLASGAAFLAVAGTAAPQRLASSTSFGHGAACAGGNSSTFCREAIRALGSAVREISLVRAARFGSGMPTSLNYAGGRLWSRTDSRWQSRYRPYATPCCSTDANSSPASRPVPRSRVISPRPVHL